MTLHDELEQVKAGFIARVPVEAQETIFRHIQEQQQSGIRFGLMEGDTAPGFKLNNPSDEEITLHNELAKGPVVLTFYRGSWCPYCNIQLRSYQQILPELQRYGAQLIAISPQPPEHTLSQLEKEQLTYQVLSDPDGHAASSYRLLFELPEYLQETFRHTLKRDLAEFNQSTRWVLPVPGTFIISREGIIHFAGVNPDFMQRVDPQEILDHLERL